MNAPLPADVADAGSTTVAEEFYRLLAARDHAGLRRFGDLPIMVDTVIGRRIRRYADAMLAGERVFTLSIAGITFELEIGDGNVGHDLFVANGELPEAESMEWVRRLPILPGSVILDIGANAGSYAIFLAKLHPGCRVVPFECHPQMCDRLRRNVARNRLVNVDTSLLGIAIGAGQGRGRLVPDLRYGAVGTHVVADVAGEVAVRPIDALGLSGVGFAKIDVEGAELSVLQGMRRLLEAEQFPVLCEVSQGNQLGFLRLLADYR
ncbi:MAG: FkbM family methyltransferase, partial [Alphaproteobacteria bacterium]